MPNHIGILNYWSDVALVDNRKFILIKAKSFQGSEHEKSLVGFSDHDINLGLPFKIVLNPEPKNFWLCLHIQACQIRYSSLLNVERCS